MLSLSENHYFSSKLVEHHPASIYFIKWFTSYNWWQFAFSFVCLQTCMTLVWILFIRFFHDNLQYTATNMYNEPSYIYAACIVVIGSILRNPSRTLPCRRIGREKKVKINWSKELYQEENSNMFIPLFVFYTLNQIERTQYEEMEIQSLVIIRCTTTCVPLKIQADLKMDLISPNSHFCCLRYKLDPVIFFVGLCPFINVRI